MRARLQLSGQRYGRLLVVASVGSVRGRSLWHCRCDCGRELDVASNNLHGGRTQSCGCSRREFLSRTHLKHGESGGGRTPRTAEYRTWAAMIRRCSIPLTIGWEYYGGRGIEVCERWRHSYELFLADMGRRPPGHSIDRIDTDGGYSPENCRWATAQEQRANRRDTRGPACPLK